MNIQLVSDLHLEFIARRSPGVRLFDIAPGADVLVLAGDVHSGSQAVDTFADSPIPVVYVLGNHEHYGFDMDRNYGACRAAAEGTAVHVLERDAVVIDGVRFLGCTLWSDYTFRSGLTQAQNMSRSQHVLRDHYYIQREGGQFTAQDALDRHTLSRAWLQATLAEPHAGPTVVVTHHGPHPRSVHPRFMHKDTIALNGAFVTDMSSELAKTTLWLHGHVHDSFDYVEAGCRVVANPRGYITNAGWASTPAQFAFENTHFRGDLLLTV